MRLKFCCTLPLHSTPNSQAPIQALQTSAPRQRGVLIPLSSNLSPQEASGQTSALNPTATSSTAPVALPNQESNISVQRHHSSVASPSSDMVSARSPLGAWHAVASKVVAVNRFRGIGGGTLVEDFKINELGGQSGRLVFGPVAVFNGNVLLQVKEPLKSMALTVTFSGVAEVEKNLVTFLSISHDVYVGDLQAGLRTFLFGFNFPYLNLPPTSRNPYLMYSFIAKLTDANAGSVNDTSSVKSRILEYKSKPLEIVFIPYIDPSLSSPHISQADINQNQRNGKGKGVESIKERPVNSTTSPQNSAGGPAIITKPKLTLTTADLPVSASSNSTPLIDKPRSLDSSTIRSARIQDDDNSTVAKLMVELPKIKFLPDDEILMRLRLTVKDGGSIPKGFGVKVVERRFLARIDSGGGEEESDSDDEERQRDMKVIGKKQSKVLVGRKITLRPEDAKTAREVRPDSSGTGNWDDGDASLNGGKAIELPIKIRLPAFQTFINDFLLPTATLPLALSNLALNSDTTRNAGNISTPTYTGKGKSPAQSPVQSTPTTASISLGSVNKDLNFVVSHTLQVAIPINGGGNWFKKSTSGTKDLEIAIPIVLGNISSSAPTRRKMPELRLNAPEEIRYGGGVDSIRGGGRSSFGSASGAGAPQNKPPTWREGERFLTLKETDIQPFFSADT